MPFVSVVMSTYNEKIEYLEQAVESVLCQTFQNFEFLIVLDNPENVQIRDRIRKYAAEDKRIIVIQNEMNMGLTKSLNKAITVARGQYMFRMDADDVIDSACLKTEIKQAEKENLTLVSSSKINIDEEGKELGTYINSFSPDRIKHLLPYDNSINHPSALIRMDSIRKLGGYREIPSCEDYDLWLRLLKDNARIRIIPKTYLHYRVRKDGIGGKDPLLQREATHYVKNEYKKGKLGNETSPFLYRQHGKERYRNAYNQFYLGLAQIRERKLFEGTTLALRAFMLDYRLISTVVEKIVYQIRKRIVLLLVR